MYTDVNTESHKNIWKWIRIQNTPTTPNYKFSLSFFKINIVEPMYIHFPAALPSQFRMARLETMFETVSVFSFLDCTARWTHVTQPRCPRLASYVSWTHEGTAAHPRCGARVNNRIRFICDLPLARIVLVSRLVGALVYLLRMHKCS